MMKCLPVVFLTILLMGAACMLTAHAQRVVRQVEQTGSFQSGRLLFAVAFRPGTDELIIPFTKNRCAKAEVIPAKAGIQTSGWGTWIPD